MLVMFNVPLPLLVRVMSCEAEVRAYDLITERQAGWAERHRRSRRRCSSAGQAHGVRRASRVVRETSEPTRVPIAVGVKVMLN